VFGEYGFWVELDAVDWVLFVAEAHDFVFSGPCGDFEAVWKGVAFDDE
jgi:hypothetical protein